MIVRNIVFAGEAVEKIEILFAADEIVKLRKFRLDWLMNTYELNKEDAMEMANDYLKDDWMTINFVAFCDIIEKLYYRGTFSFAKARNLNIILREGVKLTHVYFTVDEWMILSGLSITYEDGVRSSVEEYFKDRKGESFKYNYRLKEIPDLVFTVNLLNGLLDTYKMVVKKNGVKGIVDKYNQFFEELKFNF